MDAAGSLDQHGLCPRSVKSNALPAAEAAAVAVTVTVTCACGCVCGCGETRRRSDDKERNGDSTGKGGGGTSGNLERRVGVEEAAAEGAGLSCGGPGIREEVAVRSRSELRA
jgi:hypothetical protein